MKKINIGIVGTGGMGKIHTTAYMKNSDAYVYGVYSITRDLAQEFTDEMWGTVAYYEGNMGAKSLHKIGKVHDDYRHMAVDPAIAAA